MIYKCNLRFYDREYRGVGVQPIFFCGLLDRDSLPAPDPVLLALIGVLPTVFSNNRFAAGVKLSACLLGVAGGPILPGVFPPLKPEDDELGRDVKPLALSLIDRLALSANRLPISSRFFVSGNLNAGCSCSCASSGSPIPIPLSLLLLRLPPSKARGVARSVPQVRRAGRSCGEGEASGRTSG